MTIYYDTLLNGLIPVEFIGYAETPANHTTGCYNVVVKLKRGAGAYQKGEILHLPNSLVVEKAGRRGYQQLVRTAALPERAGANTIKSDAMGYIKGVKK